MATERQKPETKRAATKRAAPPPAVVPRPVSAPSPSGLSEAADAVLALTHMARLLSRGVEDIKKRAAIKRPPLENNITAAQSKEEEAWTLDVQDQALLDSFDSRLAEAHRGMDRILARLNVE